MGGNVVMEDTHRTGDKDFSVQIAKLKGGGAMPGVLFIASGPEDIFGAVLQITLPYSPSEQVTCQTRTSH
jgi:hypothetical protein